MVIPDRSLSYQNLGWKEEEVGATFLGEGPKGSSFLVGEITQAVGDSTQSEGVQFFHPVAERVTADSQKLGGAHLVSPAPLQGLAD